MMKNGKIKSIERIEKKDGTVDFKLGIDDKLYILHNVEISQGNLEHNEDDSHSLSINFTFDYLDDKIFRKMNEDYVSFETAKLLKEKGFDGDTNCYYIEGSVDKNLYYSPIRNNHNKRITNNEFDINIDIDSSRISAPTLQMAMKWLRKMYDLYIMLGFERPNCVEYKIYKYESELAKRDLLRYNYEESYEEACETAIKYCLENLI